MKISEMLKHCISAFEMTFPLTTEIINECIECNEKMNLCVMQKTVIAILEGDILKRMSIKLLYRQNTKCI